MAKKKKIEKNWEGIQWDSYAKLSPPTREGRKEQTNKATYEKCTEALFLFSRVDFMSNSDEMLENGINFYDYRYENVWFVLFKYFNGK